MFRKKAVPLQPKTRKFKEFMPTNLSVRVPAYVPKVDMPDLQHKLEQFVLLLYPRPKAKAATKDWTETLAGKWEDNISADEQVSMIRSNRTANRDISL